MPCCIASTSSGSHLAVDATESKPCSLGPASPGQDGGPAEPEWCWAQVSRGQLRAQGITCSRQASGPRCMRHPQGPGMAPCRFVWSSALAEWFSLAPRDAQNSASQVSTPMDFLQSRLGKGGGLENRSHHCDAQSHTSPGPLSSGRHNSPGHGQASSSRTR